LPSGDAKMGDQQFIVKVNTLAPSIDDLNKLPIKQVGGATVYLSDVAHVRDAWAVQQNIVRSEGRRSVLLLRIEWSDAASHAAWRSALFANDLDQHALAAPSVELAIKNLLPRTEVEFTRRDRDHNLPPHNLAFHMGIGIVLAGSVVTVA
jgi:hypothetical protein